MRIHAQQERDEQVVRIPEGLERLLPDPMVGRCVHEQHAQQHDVARDSSSLCIVDLNRGLRSNLVLLDIKEVDVVSRDMNDGEHKHCICYLAVEPL